MTIARPPFEQIVFSGGGIRCFWHGGWMEVVSDTVEFAPERVTGVSGGALSAAAWMSGNERKLLDTMKSAFDGEDANVTWHDIDDDHGLTPHQRVYQQVVETVIDAEAQAKIADGPRFQILLGRPIAAGPSLLHAVTAGLGYQLEKKTGSHPKSTLPKLAGMGTELVDANKAAREGRLPDLIRVAATIPPIFRIEDWDGAPSVDGGMCDQAPLPEPDHGTTLILLTRTYDRLPEDTERLRYVCPDERVLEDRIDFTDPAKVQQAWEAGREDGEDYLNTLKETD